MKDECRTEKQVVPKNDAESIELAQELLRSVNVLVNTVPPSEVLVPT